MKIAKRVLSLLLCVMVVLAAVPFTALAADSSVTAVAETEERNVTTYEDFMGKFYFLEAMAFEYVNMYPGSDPLELVIKYIRTGVDRYNSGSWNIMAGYEDAAFAEFVLMVEEMLNAELPEEERVYVSSLKNIENFYLPNGDYVDIGHMFGTMDITYHNYNSQNHADVGGWAGDLTDLLSVTDAYGVSGTLNEMIEDISENYLFKHKDQLEVDGQFTKEDFLGDIDALYLMQTVDPQKYELDTEYSLTSIMTEYFSEDLDIVKRCEYLLKNRLGSTGTRQNIRDIVYKEYTSNKVISTLEGTRTFQSKDVATLRKACCYAFADYLCKMAGDYVEDMNNPYFEVFQSETSDLAPGITQELKKATSADNKQMVYYLATADITRDDVNIYANYNNNDPTQWAMSRVIDQANAAQKKYGDPESEHYVENYNVIASINGAGYNMETGEPGGLLVMGGVEYHPINSNGFFGILDDGTAMIGTTEEYNTIYKDRLKEGIAGFGSTLIKDGKIVVSKTENYFSDRASRTAIGITKTGKVVFMVCDGRQEPISCGGSMIEIAQILYDAGCVNAVNLDGGGSTTYVAKQPGSTELEVINNPSDGASRSVSASLIAVSTAPSSTKFDHAILESEYDYLTVGTSIKLNPLGVSATGNAVDMPEGYVWEVADSRFGTVSQDGTFTATRNGSVDVRVVLDGVVIGTKTMHVVTPDNVYFKKTILSAVYGSTTTLPAVVLYDNKPVSINSEDIVFTLSNDKAGEMSGYNFIAAAKTSIKMVTITATLTCNAEINATVTINLFDQGEATFDFDNATGGNRLLAWDRKVSNSETEDTINYTAVNVDEDMVTSYIVAMDMTQIPIPPVLKDLTYMLPNGDLEDATAWTFLCQLAERVSVLTEVRATLKLDPDFDVDYSDLKVVNEYFNLNRVEFDEETNSLTVVLNWIDQTTSIDMSTANPLCIVSGIKLAPKSDAAWKNGRLVAENTGDIGYKVYLRASQLYSFSSNPENQQQFQLYPFVNPNDSSEKGGYFENTYMTFYDTYNLVKTIKEGWVSEEGGFAYYVDGVKLTGMQKIDDLYYDFGANGINDGQLPYTGVFFDVKSDVYRYTKNGVLTSGWQSINDEWYYFKSSTMAAVSGKTKVNGVYFNFAENGRLLSGTWVNTLEGVRYYVGPSYHWAYWLEIDGEKYYFKNGYRVSGYQYVRDYEYSSIKKWYEFDENGACIGVMDGIYEIDGTYYYIEDGIGVEKHLLKYNGEYYYSTYAGKLAVNKSLNTASTSCDLPKGTYSFGPDGKMIGSSADGEIVEIDGTLYYYEKGKGVEKGLVCVDGEYYYTTYKGKVAVDKTINVSIINCNFPKGTYMFGSDGKMIGSAATGEIVEIDGVLYYYENGKGVEKGLINLNGDYYYTAYKGKLVINQNLRIPISSCELPRDFYEFGADGKMLQGIVEKDGVLYYYENGKGVEKGLFKYKDNYYYAAYKGKLVVSKILRTPITNCDLPNDTYEFGADGKMLQGIVEKDDVLYYYENGKGVEKGLFKYEDNYYYAAYNGKLVVSKVLRTPITNCDLPNDTYEFGADGKMLQGIVEKDGVLYFFENGRGIEKGLFKYEDNYYYAAYKGKLAISTTVKAPLTSCDLPSGTSYEFGADGKMLQGIIERDGVLYYFENGKGVEKGLFKLGDDYYYAAYKGKLVVNTTLKAPLTSCDLPTGAPYEFGADGKMLQGIIERDGVLYFYENGIGAEKGLFYYEGHYYYSVYKGKLVTDRSFKILEGNGLLVETTYIFNELGQIIG